MQEPRIIWPEDCPGATKCVAIDIAASTRSVSSWLINRNNPMSGPVGSRWHRIVGAGEQTSRRSPSWEMCGGPLEVKIDGPKLARRCWIARGMKRCRLLHDCHNPFAMDRYSLLVRQVRVQTTTRPLGRTRSPVTEIDPPNSLDLSVGITVPPEGEAPYERGRSEFVQRCAILISKAAQDAQTD